MLQILAIRPAIDLIIRFGNLVLFFVRFVRAKAATAFSAS